MDSLLLSCRALSSPTTCRFISGALWLADNPQIGLIYVHKGVRLWLTSRRWSPQDGFNHIPSIAVTAHNSPEGHLRWT
jgi:hypothetical protein